MSCCCPCSPCLVPCLANSSCIFNCSCWSFISSCFPLSTWSWSFCCSICSFIIWIWTAGGGGGACGGVSPSTGSSRCCGSVFLILRLTTSASLKSMFLTSKSSAIAICCGIACASCNICCADSVRCVAYDGPAVQTTSYFPIVNSLNFVSFPY